MHNFEYRRALTLEAACKQLASQPESKPLAGGMSIVPIMRHRLAHPSGLVDLAGIVSLRGIEDVNGQIRIGAMATHYAVSKAAVVRSRIPALVQLASGIGDPLVRNRGTIGGSLAHNDPGACYPSSILALGATIHTSQRDIAADDFIVGMFTTALEPAEIITAVSLPIPLVAAYMKFINASSRFSIVGVFVARFADKVRIGITGAGHHAFRPSALEAALTADFTPESARNVIVPPDNLISDTNGSAQYRAELIPELTARAVAECLAGRPGAIV
jgi:carbon-monoxide dehydrogenase medium subunit